MTSRWARILEPAHRSMSTRLQKPGPPPSSTTGSGATPGASLCRWATASRISSLSGSVRSSGTVRYPHVTSIVTVSGIGIGHSASSYENAAARSVGGSLVAIVVPAPQTVSNAAAVEVPAPTVFTDDIRRDDTSG